MQHSLNVSIDAYIEFNTHFFLLAVWTRFVVVVVIVVFNTTLKKFGNCQHLPAAILYAINVAVKKSQLLVYILGIV